MTVRRKMQIEGVVEFKRSEIGKPPYCVCCGEPSVPHAHVYSEYVAFPSMNSLFSGLKDQSVQEYLERFIYMNYSRIEGRVVRVTFEVLPAR